MNDLQVTDGVLRPGAAVPEEFCRRQLRDRREAIAARPVNAGLRSFSIVPSNPNPFSLFFRIPAERAWDMFKASYAVSMAPESSRVEMEQGVRKLAETARDAAGFVRFEIPMRVFTVRK